jgi:hypothetical protein
VLGGHVCPDHGVAGKPGPAQLEVGAVVPHRHHDLAGVCVGRRVGWYGAGEPADDVAHLRLLDRERIEPDQDACSGRRRRTPAWVVRAERLDRLGEGPGPPGGRTDLGTERDEQRRFPEGQDRSGLVDHPPSGRTATPAASSAVRTAAARRRSSVVAVDAEGVGGERQQRPVVRSDGAVANEGERLGGDGGRVVDDAALEAPRAQRPVRLVAPVGECLGGDRQPRRPADLESVGAGVRDG